VVPRATRNGTESGEESMDMYESQIVAALNGLTRELDQAARAKDMAEMQRHLANMARLVRNMSGNFQNHSMRRPRSA
jgi:superoxide dismutase